MRRDLIPYRRVAKLDTLEDVRRFHDRADAGRQLAQRLDAFRGQDVVVLGLPRGGVPVAFEVAKALRVPLDVVVVRKLGVPFQPELAFGAIGEGGVRVINDSVVRHAGLSRDDMDAVEDKQRAELQRRSEHFRRGRDRISLTGRTAVIVDDGIATGATVKAACQVAAPRVPARWRWRFRSAQPKPSRPSPSTPTRWCVWPPLSSFSPSGRATATSDRPPTTR